MSEPRRLFDETDDALERRLLAVGRSEKSTARARAQTLTALGITGSAAVGLAGSAALAASSAATGAVPASATAVGKLTWAKGVMGLSALSAVVVVPPAYRAWHRPHAGPVTARPVVVARPGAADVAAPMAFPATPDRATVGAAGLGPAPPGAAAARPAPVTPARRTATGVSSAAGDPTLLTRELGALDAVRAALARRQAPRALALLDTYGRDYPKGRLAIEAEILRIDGLAQVGRTTEARERALVFLDRHPHSVLAARARRYLDD